MFQATRILRVFVPVVGLAMAACAQPASPPPNITAMSDAELAGAWYQVYFDTNKTEIDARGKMIINNVAHVVANTDTTRVTVIRKTDRVGSEAANMALSQKRADVVRTALINAGIPMSRIETSWTGEGKQEVSTSDDASDRRNRVVDITVIKQAR